MKVLFVSIAFPPKSDPECIQTAKYFHHLSKNDEVSMDVVTSKIPTLYMPEDKDLKKYDTNWNQKIEINISENKIVNFLIRKLFPSFIDRPDSKYLFHKQWKKVINKLKRKPEIIYSRSFPVSSSILAYKLKKHYNVPWVMHLSDPWYHSPLHSFKNKKLLKWHELWEQKCFEYADKICFTSKQAVSLYTENYPSQAHKFLWYPNTFEVADIKSIDVEHPSKLRFVYTGGLVGKRSIEWLLPVFERINKNNAGISKKVEFIFAGAMDRYNIDLIKNISYPFVKHIGSISYKESKKLQLSAHILLVIDNPPNESNVGVFFPSKILDYFIAQKPILAITSKSSSTEESLENWLASCYEHGKFDQVYEYIVDMQSKAEKQNFQYFKTPNPPEEFEASHNANRLYLDLKNLLELNS